MSAPPNSPPTAPAGVSASPPPAPSALVLGASGVLGGACARALQARGYRVGWHAFQHPERCPETAENPVYRADLRDRAQTEALVAAFLRAQGRLDVVVWAAGWLREAPVITQPEAEVRAALALGLGGPFWLAQACTRPFLRQRGGALIFLASHAARSGRRGGAAYAMAQSGLLALVKSLAREWGASGVRVNAVLPPFVPGTELSTQASPAFLARVAARNVLRSRAAPELATAEFVAGLASHPTASGQVFAVDSRIGL